MSSNEENSSQNLQSPVAKKLRKQWKYDSSKPVPKTTYYRWRRNFQLLEDPQNAGSCENDNENKDNSEVGEFQDDISSGGNSEMSELQDDISSSVHEGNSEVGEFQDDISSVQEGNSEVSELRNNTDSSIHENNSEVSEVEDDTECSNLEDDPDNLVDHDFLVNSDNEDDCSNYSDAESCRSITDLVTMLYDDSHISLTRSVLLVVNFYVTHKLSKASLQGILNILQELIPQPNKMPKTLYHLFKFVENAAVSIKIIKHYYCKKCLYYNGSEVQLAVCSSCLSAEGFSYFYEIDLVDLIKYMFEERNLWSKLRSSNEEDDVISDITSGSEYRRVSSNRKAYDLTLILNTDGLSLVKSSKSHCWPLMLMIAELPEHLRESFICIIGLWYDTNQKPLMNTFLQPFCEKLVQCYYEGITWVHPVTKEMCTTKIIVPLFIADAPARAEIQNIMYFSGRYGCNICEIKTQKCRRVDGRRRTRAYIFHERLVNLRNGARMENQALEVLNNNLDHKKGVKGLSVVSALPSLDLGTCVLPEYMHSVLLGVGKQFFNLWINKKGDWCIKHLIPEVDKILLDIRPPSFFNRMPRSLTLLQYYKASEFYNLLLFYCLPIFIDFLPDVFFQHWILLVAAIYNLLKRSIHVLELEQSESLLKLFVRDIQDLYSDGQYTYNVHQLLHLVLCIKRWGPLWSTSAFPFENVNGILASCVHGSKHLGQEMVKNLTIAQGLQCLKIMCQQDQNTSNDSNEWSFQLLDKQNISVEDINLLEFVQSSGFIVENIKFYSRVKLNKDIFTSKNYKTTKTNNYTVKVIVDSELIYGEIEIFIEIENNLHIIIKPFTIEHAKMFCHRDTSTVIRHILPIIETNQYIDLKLNNIQNMTHMIRVTNYICEPPNTLHKVM